VHAGREGIYYRKNFKDPELPASEAQAEGTEHATSQYQKPRTKIAMWPWIIILGLIIAGVSGQLDPVIKYLKDLQHF
jgi:hypothetical protein